MTTTETRADIERVMREQMNAWSRVSPERAADINFTSDFVLRLGRRFPTARRWRTLGEPKACFENSTRLMLKHGLQYVEGFAFDHKASFLFHHAWVFDPAEPGTAIETTLPDPANYSYLGVPLTPAQVRDAILQSKVYGVFDGHRYARPFMQRLLRERAGLAL
jgi:hypothetical protein